MGLLSVHSRLAAWRRSWQVWIWTWPQAEHICFHSLSCMNCELACWLSPRAFFITVTLLIYRIKDTLFFLDVLLDTSIPLVAHVIGRSPSFPFKVPFLESTLSPQTYQLSFDLGIGVLSTRLSLKHQSPGKWILSMVEAVLTSIWALTSAISGTCCEGSVGMRSSLWPLLMM